MELRSKAVKGVKWIGLTQATRQVVQIGALAILAILLDPDDFGLLTMALVVTGFVDLFKDLGTRVAIIQKKDPSDTFLSSIFWVNVGIGTSACLLLLCLAPSISQFYNEPRLTSILQVLAIGFPISGVGISVKAYLEKNMSFGKVGLIETISVIAGALSAIVLATMGYGVWSLVAQSLSVITISTFLFWYNSKWLPSFQFDWLEIKGVLGYSLNYSAFTLTNFMARNFDYLLIGKFLGKESLGYYTLAYRIMVYPLQNISGVLNRVMFPVLSTIQDENDRIRNGFMRVVGATALVAFPLMLGVMGLADPFVHLVFGDPWLPVIPLLIILASVGMMQSIVSTTGAIYLIKEKTGALLAWGILNGTSLIAGFWIGLQWGITGVAWAYLIVSLLMFYPALYIPLQFIELKVSKLFSIILPPLVAGIVMAVFVYVASKMLPDSVPRHWLGFSTIVLSGICIYCGITMLINKPQIDGLIKLFKERTF